MQPTTHTPDPAGHPATRRARAGRRRRPPVRLAVEPLGERVVPATYTVTNTDDYGAGSLRQAILDANANSGPDTIAFAGPGVMTIRPLSQLPMVRDAVTIDGTTAPGYVGTPVVELDGSLGQGGFHGLVVRADNCTIRGLVVHSFNNGIVIDGTAGSQVLGNYVGTDVTGTLPRGNRGVGVFVYGPNNTVGAPGAGNLISANGDAGVQVYHYLSPGNVVQANRIGTDASGTVALGNETGVYVSQAAGTRIGGTEPGAGNLISGNLFDGIAVLADSTVIQGNLVGTDVTGAEALGNGGNGIDVVQGSDGTVIGGTTPAARNVIAANQYVGVRLINQVTGSLVQGNYIATDATGTVALPNPAGVVLELQSGHNTIGGTAAGAGNLISGNLGAGIQFTDQSASQDMQFNVVQGNLIGTDVTGARALGNQTGISFNVRLATWNTIGGTAAGAGNVVSGNRGDGIVVGGSRTDVHGNRVGTSADGTVALGNGGAGVIVSGSRMAVGGTAAGAGNVIAHNGGAGVIVVSGWNSETIAGNAIYANGGLGIDLNGDGVTPNDPGDADFGTNDQQNFPVLAGAWSGPATRVTGALNSKPNQAFTLDFYASAAPDPSGYGEGARYLGSTTVTTDAGGNAAFDVTLPAATLSDELITATATDSNGSTSEFSLALPVAPVEVDIDVLPGDAANVIDLNATGGLAVAVLTTPEFDAVAAIDATDLAAIRFGDPAGSVRVSPERETLGDADNDGDVDRVFVFSIPAGAAAGALTGASTQAQLTGPTFAGEPFRGVAAVTVTPLNRGPVVTGNAGLTADQGAVTVIPAGALSATDPDGDPVTYTVTADPAFGTLLVGGSPAATFTQADVATGRVSYQHNDTRTTADSFTFTISDGRLTTGPATFSITIRTRPLVTVRPADRTAFAGELVAFTAAADASPSAAVRWQVSAGGLPFADVPGATSPTLTFRAAVGQDGNRYRAVFTNAAGTATTDAATLTVTPGLELVTDPAPQTAVVGTTATFTAAATGSPRPRVRWQVSHDGGATFADLPGATGRTLRVKATATVDGNLYRAVFTNRAGSLATAAAGLAVDYRLNVGAMRKSLAVPAGAPVALTGVVSGLTGATVHWEVSADRGRTYTLVPGATAATLTFVAGPADDGTYFRAAFTAGTRVRWTAPVVLTVGHPPTVTSPPADVTVARGKTATFSVAFSGTPVVRVQWQVSTDGGQTFTNVRGATRPTLTLPRLTAARTGNLYRVVLTNPFDQVVSPAARLTVT